MATKTWVGQQGFAYASSLSNYLPLSGGRLTGALYIGNNSSGVSPYIYWGDGSYVYIGEDSDDHMKLYGSKGINLTTGTGYDLQWNAKTIATKEWVGQQGYLTSVSFSQLTTHPTTLEGYGITDAKIQNGTITLGTSTITPITTETDPTVPAWAKASTKPSYSFGELNGTVAYNQLPTLYWANVAVANASDNNTSPQFGSVRIKPGSANYGGYLYFGDGTYAYICEPSDDNLQYKVGSSKTHTFTVGSTDRFTISSTGVTINGGMSLSGFIDGATNIELKPSSSLAGNGGYIDFHYNQSSSDYTARIIEDASGRIFIDASAGLRIGDCVITWDATNNALKIQKTNGSAANFYATGGVAALQTT